MKYQFIDADKISDMLFKDSEYVAEFCEAGVTSFDEFIENYRIHLLDRNMTDLRKAGHKIKPGAQMMGADEVVDEYEHAKSLLDDNADNEELEKSVDKMSSICSTIQKELTHLANSQN
ncbi:taurine dioxygenase [Fodinibius sp.]|uniref:taurine dioxygenase n=1 Tax=Fodinibius sp. TaxID=1872440 RepID=UPI002ACE2FA3|nr:taurine dioxygenase [Fodinibius sp.]MDZ7659199.1 taurine dioxygenase [Fodinibius sp.]